MVQENLKNALAVCSRAVATSSTLAILGNVLLKTQNGLLKISATNLEIGISQLVRCKVEEEGVVCLPARLLVEVVNNLPGEPVTLETVAEGLQLSVGKYRTVLKTVPAEDFPVINDALGEDTLSLPSQDFFHALEGVLFAVSTNETQIELCGVYMARSSSNEIVLAGTDRYRLAESKVVLKAMGQIFPNISIVIPSRAASEVLRLLHNSNTEFKVSIGDNQAVFSVDETIITTRLVDAQYPEYEAIIPREFTVSITTSRTELMSALKAVSVFAKGASGISVAYSQSGGLVLSARSQDAGEGVVEVAAEVSGAEDTILFNHKYLLDMLQFLTSQNVHIKLNNPTTPVILQSPDDKSYMYLVMPIKT